MKYGMIIVFVLTVLSCTNDKVDIVNTKDLRGKWIEM